MNSLDIIVFLGELLLKVITVVVVFWIVQVSLVRHRRNRRTCRFVAKQFAKHNSYEEAIRKLETARDKDYRGYLKNIIRYDPWKRSIN